MIRRVAAATITDQEPQRGMIEALGGLFGRTNLMHFDFMRESQFMPRIRLNNWFASLCVQHKPDWIWLQVQDTDMIAPETILRIRKHLPRCVISHWMGDARLQVSPYLSEICKNTHLTLISSVGQLEMFREAGAERAEYLQVGIDWPEDTTHLDWKPPFRVPDVVFCGNDSGDRFSGGYERRKAVELLVEAGIDVGIVGGGWPKGFPVIGTCMVYQQGQIYRRAKVCININHLNDIRGYYSDRQLISMASGTPLVCRYIPGLENEFQDGMHLRWFHVVDELPAIVSKLLADEPARLAMGRAGRAEVLRNHTWFSRFLSVLPTIEQIQSQL